MKAFLKKELVYWLIIFFSINIIACQEKPQNLSQYKWLLGHWIAKDKAGKYHEKWYEQDDTKFYGEAWLINEGDTLFSEKLSLELINDTLFYLAKFPNGYLAKFRSDTIGKGYFQLHLPENDFPSIIRYEKMSQNEFVAILKGEENGDNKTEVLEFERQD